MPVNTIQWERVLDKIIMNMSCPHDHMLVEINPNMYQSYILSKNLQKLKVLYVQVNTALHGMLQLSLLLYKKFK